MSIAAFVVLLPAMALTTADQINQHIAAGEGEVAFALAEANIDQAGEAEFDFYYGLAAMSVGKPALAALAFERVLYSYPESPRVELELGRAYFYLADWNRAEGAFKKSVVPSMPTNTKNIVDAYLKRIEAFKRHSNVRTRTSLSLLLGNDSNINSATDEDLFTISGTGSIFNAGIIAEEDQEKSDSFVALNGHWQRTHPVHKQSSFYYSAGLDSRQYLSESDFSHYRVTLETGWQGRMNQWSLRVPMQLSAYWRDGDNETQNLSLGGEASYQLNTRWSGFGFLRVGANRYPEVEARDVDTVYLGGGVITQFYGMHWMVNLLAGDDAAKNEEVNGKSLQGVVTSWSKPLSSRQQLKLTALYFTSEHDAETLGVVREDDFQRISFQWQMAASSQWRWSKPLQWQIQVSATENESNLSIYEYQRLEVSLGVDYEL